MMPGNTEEGTQIQFIDTRAGSDSSTANTAVQQSRGAALLTQHLGNCLQTSQQSQDDVHSGMSGMLSDLCRQDHVL